MQRLNNNLLSFLWMAYYCFNFGKKKIQCALRNNIILCDQSDSILNHHYLVIYTYRYDCHLDKCLMCFLEWQLVFFIVFNDLNFFVLLISSLINSTHNASYHHACYFVHILPQSSCNSRRSFCNQMQLHLWHFTW